MIERPDVLLIAGTGQNSGKTTIICSIIKKFISQKKIYAVKITHHKYLVNNDDSIVFRNDQFCIVEEFDKQSQKDSSLMLQAGAVKSYFVMAQDDYLLDAWNLILSKIPYGTLIICESGATRKFIKPGLFFILHRQANNPVKPMIENLKPLADHWIDTDFHCMDEIIKKINIENNQWKIINK